jgi:hypothetical protein
MTDSGQPPEPNKPPAGFYPDSSGAMRWWDGNAWTDRMQDSSTPPAAGAPPTATATQTPGKKSHTLRNVLLVILGLIVLSFVGCVAILGSAVNEADKAIKNAEAKDEEPGGPENPLTINEGKAFEVSGFNYSDGWKVVDDGIGDVGIKGLKVTNNRDTKDGAIVEIKFLRGNEVVALADCSTEQIPVGQTTTLDCTSGDNLPKKYDKITINDTF